MNVPKAIEVLPAERSATRLLQPNSLTFSCKTVSALQYNILVLIVEKIQKYMTAVNLPDLEKLTIPIFSIDASEVSGINHKQRVIEAALEMSRINFTFSRMDWAAGRKIEGEGPIVTWVDDVKGTNEIRIKLNDMLVPAMTYYGKGVGGTYFVKEQTLRDSSIYTKQLRQMILSWKNREGFICGSIEKFKSMLGVNPKITNNRFKCDILEPTRLAILQDNPDVWFEYRLFASSPISGRKPKADRISISIYSKDGEDENSRSKYDDYRMVYNCIAGLAPGKAVEYTDKIAELGKLTLISTKWKYYYRERNKGNISGDYMDGALRKILAEECGIIIIKKA